MQRSVELGALVRHSTRPVQSECDVEAGISPASLWESGCSAEPIDKVLLKRTFKPKRVGPEKAAELKALVSKSVPVSSKKDDDEVSNADLLMEIRRMRRDVKFLRMAEERKATGKADIASQFPFEIPLSVKDIYECEKFIANEDNFQTLVRFCLSCQLSFLF